LVIKSFFFEICFYTSFFSDVVVTIYKANTLESFQYPTEYRNAFGLTHSHIEKKRAHRDRDQQEEIITTNIKLVLRTSEREREETRAKYYTLLNTERNK
jgi:hypothetical protein